MPIRVDITVNGQAVRTLQIARTEGRGLALDQVNIYTVIETNEEPYMVNFDKGTIMFDHRYGDGVEVCVAKAITAFKENII